jgi:anaerobic selenocysteine-containing dehydrogenase
MTTTSSTVHHRTCPLCEAVCGLEITVGEGRVTRIAGDAEDVFSRGFLCPKGATLHHLHDDPDRLRSPRVRRGDDPEHAQWEEVSWDEAFAEVERRLAPVHKQHGRDAVGIYLGNPNVHNLAGMLYARPLLKALGTRNIFTASTVDQMPKHVSCGLLFGDASAIPVPDLDRNDLLVMLGANPYESNGSLCTAPDFPRRLSDIRARGGRVVVVDPKRTRTAEHASEHVPIRPGSDALFLLAMIQVVFSEDLVSLGRLSGHVQGLAELAQLVRPFTPQAVERATQIPAATIERLARELVHTERAAVYARLGTQTVRFGTLASWAVDVLNLVTGNLDTPGGAMFARPAHGQRRSAGPGAGFAVGRFRSRVKGYPEVLGELPVATLADEIETAGEGQIRALVVVAGNPARSTPDSKRLERALAGLTCLVSVDPYLNETSRLAHVILPPPSALERSHYDLSLYGLSVRNVAKWSAPVLPSAGPSEADILARLTLIALGQGASADPALVHRELERTTMARRVAREPRLAGADESELLAGLDAREPVDRLVEIMVRTGPYGDCFGRVPEGLTFAGLRAAPHGLDLGALTPRIPEVLQTKSGCVELTPAPIVQDLARLEASLTDAPGDTLVLVGRRHLRSNNSWMHNVSALVKGPERCTLQIHPSDAARLGIERGSSARVRGGSGELVARVELTDAIMCGVVSLPHGWGHDAKGVQQRVASSHAGVNSNLLTSHLELDPLSGNAVLNGIPVTVSPI